MPRPGHARTGVADGVRLMHEVLVGTELCQRDHAVLSGVAMFEGILGREADPDEVEAIEYALDHPSGVPPVGQFAAFCRGFAKMRLVDEVWKTLPESAKQRWEKDGHD